MCKSASRPHKLSEEGLVRDTKTPMTTMKDINASAAEMGEIAYNNSWSGTSPNFIGEWQKESHC